MSFLEVLIKAKPPLKPTFLTNSISSEGVHMKCLMLIGRQESCKLSHKNHLFYPIVIESLYLSLLCLFAALL